MKLNIEHILDGKWDEEKLIFNIDCFNLTPSRTQIYLQFGHVLEEIRHHPPLLVTNSALFELFCLSSGSKFYRVLNLVCHSIKYEPGLFEKLENYAIHTIIALNGEIWVEVSLLNDYIDRLLPTSVIRDLKLRRLGV